MATELLTEPSVQRAEPRPSSTGDQPAALKKPSRVPQLVLLLLAIGGGAWGVRTWLHSRTYVTTDNAQVDGHITPIAPKVQGFVSRVLVEENHEVRAGDTLVIIDDSDFRVRLEQAEADLASALAVAGRSGQAEAQVAMSRDQAAGSQAAVAAAEAQYNRAAADLQRIRGLAERQIVAAQQLDAAQAAYDAARANLEAAKKQAAAMSSQVSMMGAAKTGANARLAAARAGVDNARLQLGYTVITAPSAGFIGKRNVEAGELVQVGQQLMSIVPTTDLWVTANLKETDLGRVEVGDRAEFTVDAYRGHTFDGTVESISPATGAKFALLPPDNATGNFTKVVQRVPVRIRIDSAGTRGFPLRPGMSVEATIETK